MQITSGTRLGPYEILALIGAGEVYRARATKLGRQVAIKILPSRWPATPGSATPSNTKPAGRLC